MRETSASKQVQAFKEIGEGSFSADRIAYQQGQKIDGLIDAEAPSHQANPARAKASISPFVAR
jgi:hypothetical protein